MEAQLRAETTRIESELERRKLELEQMEVKKQLDMVRARLKPYQEAEETVVYLHTSIKSLALSVESWDMR